METAPQPGPRRSIKITDHFTCTSANVIYCITCILCKKLYFGEKGAWLGDRFWEHLWDIEKGNKNIGNSLVRSAFETSDQPLTWKWARFHWQRCNVEKISGPRQSMKITDHSICTSANVIYCITCTHCKNLYIGETRRQLDDRFREHLCDVKKDDKNASKPVTLISPII